MSIINYNTHTHIHVRAYTHKKYANNKIAIEISMRNHLIGKMIDFILLWISKKNCNTLEQYEVWHFRIIPK